MTKVPEQLRLFLTGLVVGLILVSTISAVAFHVDGGDELCVHALGDGATYLESQSLLDQQLDCRYPNGTVAHDVDVPPMNLTARG